MFLSVTVYLQSKPSNDFTPDKIEHQCNCIVLLVLHSAMRQFLVKVLSMPLTLLHNSSIKEYFWYMNKTIIVLITFKRYVNVILQLQEISFKDKCNEYQYQYFLKG